MKEKNKANPFKSTQETPSEQDIFLDKLKDGPTAEDLFTVPFDPANSAAAPVADATPDYPAKTLSLDHKRVSNVQALLVAAVAAVIFILVYAIFFMDTGLPDEAPVGEPKVPVASAHETPLTTRPEQSPPSNTVTAQESKDDSTIPLSRRMAENLYSDMDFARAYDAYEALGQRLGQTRQGPVLQDFWRLRMALCQKGMGNIDVAIQLLRSAARGKTPVVCSLARYHEAMLLLRDGQYLDATSKAYQALALIDAVENAPRWVRLFKRYCDYLINKAVTTYTLSLYDAERELPDVIFTLAPVPDPFLNLNDGEFLTLLESGRDALEQATLGPRVMSAGSANGGPPWRIVGSGASLEETFTRFVAQAGFEIDWSYDLDSSSDMIDEALRNRPVHVLLSAASDQQACAVIAGCAGLFARIDQGNTIRIRDPRHYNSSSEHARTLALRAVDLCQAFLLTNEEPKHAPHGYLALGLLQRRMDQLSEALAALKQIYNRFPRHELAPYALLHASRFKTDMGDLLGAKEDLELLVDQYPDTEFSGNAHIYLADATRDAGFWQDAIGLYRKVYNLNMSRYSQTQAAYGAGLCCFQAEDYEGVVRWFGRFVEAPDSGQEEGQANQALLLQAQAYSELGRYVQADVLFQEALERDLLKTQYVEALAGFAEANRQQEKYVEALNRISAEHPWSFSYQDRNRVTLIKAKIYQAMGLNGKSIALLEDQLSFLSDPNQLAEAYLQLAQGYMQSDKPGQAMDAGIQGLMTGAARGLINQLRFQLAQTLLQMNRVQETIRHCQDILSTTPGQAFTNQVYGLMARAYEQDEQYEMALSVLLKQAPEKAMGQADTGTDPEAVPKYSLNQ